MGTLKKKTVKVFDLKDYSKWRSIQNRNYDSYPSKGKHGFSIITPIFEPQINQLKDLYNSLNTQSYEYWEWIIVVHSLDIKCHDFVHAISAKDKRVQVYHHYQSRSISDLTNIGACNATHSFLLFIDQDDIISNNCLKLISILYWINGISLLYLMRINLMINSNTFNRT